MNNRLNTLREEIDKLQSYEEAIVLLEQVYIELGPYTQHLTPTLRQKIQNYFNFDDE